MLLALGASLGLLGDGVVPRAAAAAAICLALWLTELVPPYAPTLVLWGLTPLLVGRPFSLGTVLTWSADPVLALFFGGFALRGAATRYGLDKRFAAFTLRLARGNGSMLVVAVTVMTAVASMWVSNIAAAALIIAALRPVTASLPTNDELRRCLLVGIALGGNLGGMATPIGSGPNAIAIAAVAPEHSVSFLRWMLFAVPLTAGLLLVGLALLRIGHRSHSNPPAAATEAGRPEPRAGWIVGVFAAAVVGWLTEPLHGVSAPTVALLIAAVLFGTGLLDRRDLAALDWSTLMLIAGGLALGKLLEESGVVSAVAGTVAWGEIPATLRILMLCLASAVLSAVMSNTATATFLIPLGAAIDPSPSTPILIAIAASLGMPFVISTPPNAMVYGEGGLRTSDLLVPGLVLMVGGCVLISLTGPAVLGLLGLR